MTEPFDPADSADPADTSDTESYDAVRAESPRDRDGVSSLMDTEAESGDEEGVDDGFELDQNEAEDVGADLDRIGGETPLLD